MSSDLEKRIYQAQCIGNVEPIEHMVPYPNLRSLIDGQNIKYGEKMVYADLGLTSDKVYRLAQQTANWLTAEGIKPKDRILIDKLPFPQTEVLVFGIWTLGASMVIIGDGNITNAKKSINPAKIISEETDYFKKIKSFPENHDPSFKPLLQNESMIFWNNKKGIRLSHYNLLVNANGIQHAVDLFEDQTYYVNLEPNSMAWMILQAILPLYSGAPMTSKNPDMVFGIDEGDFHISFEWDKLKETTPPTLYVCNENTAFLSMNKSPIHLSTFDNDTNPTKISGHSVMMGYLDNKSNEESFVDGSLKINK